VGLANLVTQTMRLAIGKRECPRESALLTRSTQTRAEGAIFHAEGVRVVALRHKCVRAFLLTRRMRRRES